MRQYVVRSVRVVLLPLLAVVSMGADKGCVTQPTPDTIVTSTSQTLKGNISEFDAAGSWVAMHDGKARLKIGAGAYSPWANTVSNVWTIGPLTLGTGVNVLSGQTQRTSGATTINGTIPQFILEYMTGITDKGTQKVFLDWSEAGIDNLIKQMATQTMEPDPTAAQLTTFVADVKSGVQSFFQQAYSGFDVTIVAAAGADTHTVKFHADAGCGLYGSSPGDFNNTNKTQTSNVYLDAFRCTLAEDLLTETAATQTDTLAQRTKDVATFIGRTAAHETGHSLGLTDESKLHGCEGMHNCEGYDAANPSDRFNSGHYIMDPGPKSALYARIGNKSATSRAWQRPVFNAYNKSYVKLIHPL